MNSLLKSASILQQEEAIKSNEPLKLPELVAEKFKVKSGIVRVFVDAETGRTVDLNTITMQQAEHLAGRGILETKD